MSTFDRKANAIVPPERTSSAFVDDAPDAVAAVAGGARVVAVAAAPARDRFFAIVSHELRSPLNAIQSWSHVLEKQLTVSGDATASAMRALEGIRAGIDQQVRLIERLLDAALVLDGDPMLARTSFALRETLESAVAPFRSSAVAKDVVLHVDLRLVDERIDGDPARVAQIFEHLLSNALKFTPRGGTVWLSADRNETEATVVVRDDGPGLAAGFEGWLFEPFGQVDRTAARTADGLGLGLALVRRLVELQGGRVEAQSAGPNLGAAFIVHLPLLGRCGVDRRPA